MILWFDTETFCEVPITNGTHAYAEKAEVMIAAWAIDDGPVTVEDLMDEDWRPQPPSEALRRALREADTIVMHKSDFDRTVTRHAWAEFQVRIDIERVHDTMVRAMAHSLPGGLDKLCAILGVSEENAKQDGKELIQLFCKPRPKNVKVRRATRYTHSVEWGRFLSYAGSDILAMRELFYKLPKWNYQGRELSLWRLDQRINDRGFRVDVELARSAVAAISQEQRRLKDRAWALTGGEVESTRKRDQLLEHILADYGIVLKDLKKDTLERLIEDPELDDWLRQLLRVRLDETTSSTAKYKRLLGTVSADERLRGTVQFCGALRTGRWGGRLFQPQNLPRPSMLPDEVELMIAATKAGSLDLIADNVMTALSNSLRGCIIAEPGRKIVASDLSNIEGRVAAFLAGEQWKLDAFAEIDADPKRPDLYCVAYARSFGVTPESVVEDKKAGGFQRQVGKVQELGLGYGGGVGAFLGFAMVYRLDLEAMAEKAFDLLPAEAREQAEGMLEWRKRKRLTRYGLSDRAFIVCEAFKALWREAHPQISSYWKALEDAARRAIAHPGEEVTSRKIRFIRQKAWLRMILPSGRSLCYPSPQVDAEGSISYLGVDQFSRKWKRVRTYGGKLFENACQATARDVLAHNMPLIEDAGFEIILTVHDEVICEATDDLTHEQLSSILATNPPWMIGCPLMSSGFEARRYRKD